MKNCLWLALLWGAAHAQAETVELNSPEFGEAVRSYLLSNPEVIFEAVDIYNNRIAEEQAQMLSKAIGELSPFLYDQQKNLVRGNPEGTKIIAEFVDYNCSWCRRSEEVLATMIENNPDLAVIALPLPLLAPGSLEAAKVVVATKIYIGNEQADALHNALFELQSPNDKFSALTLAESLGLDSELMEEKSEAEDVLEAIALSQQLAATLQIQGTPEFIIGDQLIGGYIEANEMQPLIDQLS